MGELRDWDYGPRTPYDPLDQLQGRGVIFVPRRSCIQSQFSQRICDEVLRWEIIQGFDKTTTREKNRFTKKIRANVQQIYDDMHEQLKKYHPDSHEYQHLKRLAKQYGIKT